MLMVNAWPFVIITVLLADATPSSEVSEPQSKGTFFDGAKRSSGPHDIDAGKEIKEQLTNHPEGSLAQRVTTREAKLTGKNNGRAFAGNWRNSQDNVRYSNALKKIRSNFNLRRQEGSEDVSKKAVRAGRPFTKTLLENGQSQKLLSGAMTSPFITQMVQGKLNPSIFRNFELQDAFYLSSARDILKGTAKQIASSNPEFADMYNTQAGKYDSVVEELRKKYNLPDVTSISPVRVTEDYVGYLAELSQKDPRFLAVGVLPCSQFWRSISGQLIDDVKDTSEYKSWFAENVRPPGYESLLEKFINDKVSDGTFTFETLSGFT